jgi:histidine triad (HIT) family protein
MGTRTEQTELTGGQDDMRASDCIFCKIVAGTSDSQEIYQDETTLAFMDIHPANDGHCLVIPKAHFETVFDMPPAAFGGVGSTVAKVARAVNEVLRPGGVSLIQANGELAGQSVMHVHVHVLPRRTDDNLLINWDRNSNNERRFDRERIAEIAERLRSCLRG